MVSGGHAPAPQRVRRRALTIARFSGVVVVLGLVSLAWVSGLRAGAGASVLGYGLLTAVAYLVPGLVLLLRRDWHVVGWLLVLIALSFTFVGDWATYSFGGRWILFIEALFAGSLFWYLMVALLLVFPDGLRDQLPRDRRLAVAVLAVASLGVVTQIFAAEVGVEDRPKIANPIGIGFVPARVADDVAIGLEFIGLAVAFALLVIRYRSAQSEARRQYRWVLFAITAVLVGLAIGVTGTGITGSGDVLWWLPVLVAYLALPASFMVAILRYRLYEIDRIISRSVSYAMVVGVLAVVFAAVAVGLPQVLRIPTDNQVLIAAATLAVAALFNPLRKRAQSVVDRQFNRTRYDAAREVDRFAERLRTELDLDELTDEALGVVTTTLRPAKADVWLREERR